MQIPSPVLFKSFRALKLNLLETFRALKLCKPNWRFAWNFLRFDWNWGEICPRYIEDVPKLYEMIRVGKLARHVEFQKRDWLDFWRGYCHTQAPSWILSLASFSLQDGATKWYYNHWLSQPANQPASQQSTYLVFQCCVVSPPQLSKNLVRCPHPSLNI